MEKMQIQKEEIIEVENRLFSAQLISDVETLDQLLDDKLVAVTPTAELVTKEMDLNAHRNRTMIIEDATSNIEQIEIFDDTAYTVVFMEAKGLMLGQAVEGRFRYLRVWKKQHGKLKVICASITKLN